MPRRLSFSQYLVGHASLERPPFFYAYAGMWLHLFLVIGVLAFITSAPLIKVFSSVTISSFCLGIVIYGALAREYGLLINIGSYALIFAHLFSTEILSLIFLIIAIISTLFSSHILLGNEYRRYHREIHGDTQATIPQWLTFAMGIVLTLLCIFGLNI